jgi:hypothetical protein
MKIRKVVNFPCPPQAPLGWEIYNAPRPLYGSRDNSGPYTWQGEFISGVFYAAIDPDDPDAEMWRQKNEQLDAVRLEFVSRQSVIDEMVEYYRQRFPCTFEKIFTEHPLKDEETQKMLVDTWFNLEMNWEERS